MADDRITIASMAPDSRGRWDDFVLSCESATFFHLSGWHDILERVFGYACHYLYAERDGRIVGVLPLTHFKNVIAGNALVSTPFLVYGGPCGEDDRTVDALTDEARRLAEDLDVDYLELRNREPVAGDWESKSLYVYFRKALEVDVEVNFKSIPRKQRAMVRKGIEGGLVTDWHVDLDRFYGIFVESYRNLGTPVFGKRLFQSLLDTFADHCWWTTVSKDDTPLASVMSFRFRDEILPYYGGGVAAARSAYANDYMYWAVMERATQEGYRWFDYGRSKEGTGAYRFKKHWGFEPQPLHYQYHLVNAKELPNLSPTNPKFQRAIEIWKRIPTRVARIVGPPLARRLG